MKSTVNIVELFAKQRSGVDRATEASNVMYEVEPDVYQATNGFSARREDGMTPNGNPIGGRWVLRDASGTCVDFHQYRHDLFEHNGLRTSY